MYATTTLRETRHAVYAEDRLCEGQFHLVRPYNLPLSRIETLGSLSCYIGGCLFGSAALLICRFHSTKYEMLRDLADPFYAAY